MTSAQYRIESNHPLVGRMLPMGGQRQLIVGDRGLAVSLAAKSFFTADDQEIRVVHMPTGEIVFRKRVTHIEPVGDEF
jgi:hypothetical protein